MMRKMKQDNKADPEFMKRHPLANTMLFSVQLKFMFEETSRRFGKEKARDYLYDMVVQMQIMVARGRTLDDFDIGSIDDAFEELFSTIK